MTACISSRIENYAAFMGGAFAQTVETLPANEGSFRPGEPCRDLLNPADAARYLRLDEQKIANPKAVLDGYRKNGQLRSVAVSREIYYLKPDLDALPPRPQPERSTEAAIASKQQGRTPSCTLRCRCE